MFKTIVLALDGSEGSRRAIPVAAELARQNGGRIVIAHVEQDVAGKGGAPIPVTEDEIQAEIRKQADQLSTDGIETSVEMRNVMLGGPAHPIAEIAEEANADLIVAGTRGHSPVAGLLLGSVTQRLLHIARSPVLVVPPPDRY
jgi:nucleotide-binding universal stress UspA family protein